MILASKKYRGVPYLLASSMKLIPLSDNSDKYFEKEFSLKVYPFQIIKL